jgi:hypothetical protein
LNKPSQRVEYEIEERTRPNLRDILERFTAAHRSLAAAAEVAY